MKTYFTTIGFLPLAWALILLLMITATRTTYAKLCVSPDPRGGVLDADVVAIVKQTTFDSFEIEETFFGESNVGDIIYLPDFKLATCQQDGPDLVEPITDDTHILLFLVGKDAGWAITFYGHCYFWVHNLDKVDELRKKASDALALRRSWEAARDKPDQLERVKTLWSYLWDDEYRYFFEHTKKELQKAAPVSGDFIASQFGSLRAEQRDRIIRDIGHFGGERLHQVVIDFLTDQQRKYRAALTEALLDGTLDKDQQKRPRGTALSTDGELFYGLEGLASFKNRTDLPYIRQLVTWAATQKLEQTCWAALNIFRDNPDKKNLAVISTILERFGGFTQELSAHSYFFSLKDLKTPDTIPLLIKILPDSFMGASAHDLLTEIVGADLGTDPKTWLKWYTGQTNQSQKP